MKITKLEKKKRLYLLETDTGLATYITEDTIIRFFLSKEKDISEEQWTEIQTFAQLSYGKNLALYHLSFKQRTKKEVYDYLHDHAIEKHFISQILKELEDDNWINDRHYVQNILDQNKLSGEKGPLVLQQKLLNKGIDNHTISSLLPQYNFSEIAERVAQKLLKKYQNKLPNRALQDKLIQNLLSKGFNYQQAKESVATLHIESDYELEENLIYKEIDKHFRKYAKKYEGYVLKQRLTQALARKGFDYDLIQSAIKDYM